jgi:hypothetical protein
MRTRWQRGHNNDPQTAAHCRPQKIAKKFPAGIILWVVTEVNVNRNVEERANSRQPQSLGAVRVLGCRIIHRAGKPPKRTECAA